MFSRLWLALVFALAHAFPPTGCARDAHVCSITPNKLLHFIAAYQNPRLKAWSPSKKLGAPTRRVNAVALLLRPAGAMQSRTLPEKTMRAEWGANRSWSSFLFGSKVRKDFQLGESVLLDVGRSIESCHRHLGQLGVRKVHTLSQIA